MDAFAFLLEMIGTVAFAISGAMTGIKKRMDILGVMILGLVTAGGGVMRDILAGNTPYIFIKHIYACASLAGATVCALLWRPLGSFYAMIGGAAAVFVLRVLAAHFKWNLPRARDFDI